MTTNQYKAGVLNIVARLRKYNAEIGQYISHSVAPDNEFLIQLTNGTIKLPPEAAHNQEVFPGQVPDAWIAEIERTFVKSLVLVPITEPKSKWNVIFGFLS